MGQAGFEDARGRPRAAGAGAGPGAREAACSPALRAAARLRVAVLMRRPRPSRSCEGRSLLLLSLSLPPPPPVRCRYPPSAWVLPAPPFSPPSRAREQLPSLRAPTHPAPALSRCSRRPQPPLHPPRPLSSPGRPSWRLGRRGYLTAPETSGTALSLSLPESRGGGPAGQRERARPLPSWLPSSQPQSKATSDWISRGQPWQEGKRALGWGRPGFDAQPDPQCLVK